MINLQKKHQLEQELKITSDVNRGGKIIHQLDKIDNLIHDSNNPDLAGKRFTTVLTFGDFGRYGLYAIHSRFHSPAWMIQDVEVLDDLGYPSIIGQPDTYIDAIDHINRLLKKESNNPAKPERGN